MKLETDRVRSTWSTAFGLLSNAQLDAQLATQRAALHQLLGALLIARDAAHTGTWDGGLAGMPPGDVVELQSIYDGYNPFYNLSREAHFTGFGWEWKTVNGLVCLPHNPSTERNIILSHPVFRDLRKACNA